MHQQPKEHQGLSQLPEARKSKEGSSIRGFRGTMILPTPCFRLLASELGEYTFLLLSNTQFVVICYSSPDSLIHAPVIKDFQHIPPTYVELLIYKLYTGDTISVYSAHHKTYTKIRHLKGSDKK